MDFRDPSRMSESDDAILDEPYRPFYSIFGGQPILVKQYVVYLKYSTQKLKNPAETMNMIALYSEKDLSLVFCYSTMSRRMRGITQQMSEVFLPKDIFSVSADTVFVAFLSWLKLSVYMAIVSVAIVLSFHLQSKPSALGKCLTSISFRLQAYTGIRIDFD